MIATDPDPALPKRIDLRFLLNPVRFEADENDPTRLGAVVCERTQLVGEVGHQKAVGTGEYERIPANMALVSIGYKSVSVPGLEEFFGDDGMVRHQQALVDAARNGLAGLYVAGWLKRGPSGMIGTNIGDAKETVAAVLKDLEGTTPKSEDANLRGWLEENGVEYVDWQGYQNIVRAEGRNKRSEAQPREKITSIAQLLEVAKTEG